MKKTICLFAAAVLLAGCGGGAETKELTGTADNGEGLTTTAKVTKEGDKITKVEIDETYKDKEGNDTTKKTLKDDYNMKPVSEQTGIGKEWYEQVQYLEKYIVDNGVDKIQLGDDGKATNTDVLSGCTINIKPYVEAVKNAK